MTRKEANTMDLHATRVHCRELLNRIYANGNRRDYPTLLAAETKQRLQTAHVGSNNGESLPGAEAMKLGIALHVLELRDCVIAGITPDNAMDRLTLWTNIAMHVHPVFVAPAATVAAHAASLAGQRSAFLAALEVALTFQPDYWAAQLLLQSAGRDEPAPRMDDLAEQLHAEQPTADWLRPLAARLRLFRQLDLRARAGELT
ncbi:DUF4192 family protein [Streptosporangium sp. NPDC023963]|uniref:DUF4192 family protein n=1 Tax=Streptosporangium sp. NPDC023963 TaxID=3155608 RepID=UPI00342DC1A5